MKTHKVEIGSGDSVIIDKCFGPLVFLDLKITADFERGWVIERYVGSLNKWVEWVVIPGQLDIDFLEDDDER